MLIPYEMLDVIDELVLERWQGNCVMTGSMPFHEGSFRVYAFSGEQKNIQIQVHIMESGGEE